MQKEIVMNILMPVYSNEVKLWIPWKVNLKLTEKENVHNPMSDKEFLFVNEILPKKKAVGPLGFTAELYQTLRKEEY